MSKEKTGGVRLEKMIREGQIDRPYLWIDTYHQVVKDIADTIQCGIDYRCLHYVTVEE